MVTDGELRKVNGDVFRVTMNHSKYCVELIISDGINVLSAYKKTKDNEQAYKSKDARKLYKLIEKGLKGCTSKNGYPSPFTMGTSITYNVSKQGTEFSIEKYQDSICGLEISNEQEYVYLEYNQSGEALIPKEIPYVKLASSFITYGENKEEQDVVVRTLDEIALEKDITWLNNKKYYIVNDERTAEQIFSFLENYNGMISFDTETTGLKINMFGKIGSERKKQLEDYNREQAKNNKETIRVDRLVGIIFCVEKDVSYYFPCWNRKFKNIYSDCREKYTARILDRIKADYTIGKYRNRVDDMARYIRNTNIEDIEPDVILMERCREILEKGNLLAHNGTFEWKVCWLYNILFNLTDDSMLMHQLMYKFRSTTSNRGEPSNLKYLTKLELGIDQLDLNDFFVDYAEMGAEVRSHNDKKKKRKKKNAYIDFSYMDYDGSKAYAPADGDFTLQLGLKYKKDMKENHRDLEYLYSVEILVSQAIAYMEFYGIRIDEEKIEQVKQRQITGKLKIEHEIRKVANITLSEEDKWFSLIDEYLYEEQTLRAQLDSEEITDKFIEKTKKEIQSTIEKRIELQDNIREKFDNQENGLNLASPAQVADLFYNKLGLPLKEDKPSVSKKVLKQYLKLKDDNGNLKYPFVNMYTDWKRLDTLLTKFFDNLPYFMYPGGFIFASFGQISTATGRMSCNKPNLQQLPKDVTSIVVPRDGYVQIDGDFSQIEYRTLVALARETSLIEKFKDPDMDYHTTMASLMYGVPYELVTAKMRGDAKSFNFGIPYGMGFGSLAILLHGVSTDVTRADAREKYELYFKDQPRVRQFFNDVKESANVYKYTKTKWNRRRDYSFKDKDGNFSQAKKAAALRQAGNAVIQGCVHGNTLIQTKELGVTKIEDVVNTHLHVWDGEKWSEGDILYSGKKQKCIVHFSNGQEFICSPIHRFKIHDNTFNELKSINPHWKEDIEADGFIGGQFVRCKDLKQGQAICINEDSDLHINDYENRYNKVECYGVSDTDNNKVECYGVSDTDNNKVYKYKNSIPCIIVESVEITDEYIDMYDVCNTDRGYYVADGIITHNTAADIFKIAVARNFSWIKSNGLLGDVLITNMIHDEQLLEVNATELNVQKVLSAFVENMEMSIDGFPPLFCGAGVAMSWKEAKGKMAEIHPDLAHQLQAESKNMDIRLDKKGDPKSVIDYFDKRVYEFRRDKIIKYITNEANHNKVIDPVIGSLLSLQFDYGVTEKYNKLYNNDNYTKEEKDKLLGMIPIEQLRLFIEENKLDIDYQLFKNSQMLEEDVEEDVEYEDGEENENGLDLDEFYDSDFVLIDEDDKLFGVDLQDLIKKFGLIISTEQAVCGIDATTISFKQIDTMADYLKQKICDKEDDGAMQVVLLTHSNIINKTGMWVKNIDGSKMSNEFGLNSILYR